MRKTTSSTCGWVFHKGELVGISLGSDAVAEHEWGVKRMMTEFETDDSKDGIERRMIRAIPKDFRLVEYKNGLGLFLSPKEDYWRQPEGKDGLMETVLRGSPGRTLVCAWDEKSFGIVAYDDENKAHVRTLFDAFLMRDVTFWTNVGVFQTGFGLIFGIASKIPEEDKERQLFIDKDRLRLLKVAAQSGVEEALHAAGVRWYSIRPAWAKSIQRFAQGSDKTEWEVVFWFNPVDQLNIATRYWSVEQLHKLAKDTKAKAASRTSP